MVNAPFKITPKISERVITFSTLPKGRHFVFAELGPNGKEHLPSAPDHVYTKMDASFCQPLDGGERFIVSWRRFVCEIILVVEPIRPTDQPDEDALLDSFLGHHQDQIDNIMSREG
jgi:hypothetical protein